MSGDIYLDTAEPSHPDFWWNASSGVIGWVIDVLIEHVTDPGLKAELVEYRGITLFGVGLFEERAPELVRVLRTELYAAAESAVAAGGLADWMLPRIAELARYADWWAELNWDSTELMPGRSPLGYFLFCGEQLTESWWIAPRELVLWVLDVLLENASSPGLVAKLGRLREARQALLSTLLFDEHELAEVLAILRWRLRPAAERTFSDQRRTEVERLASLAARTA
ncbi:hypothetical protein [Amycolatopsis orientalis]|uniref:hypothetical protein n=1 Tax=Amycolatopsis orientalis TaxID=31958 RepID=UPI00041730BF|nr:hypothetical protein [Amycolatopsis orientalis]